jgi:hypothetical protein
MQNAPGQLTYPIILTAVKAKPQQFFWTAVV